MAVVRVGALRAAGTPAPPVVAAPAAAPPSASRLAAGSLTTPGTRASQPRLILEPITHVCTHRSLRTRAGVAN